MISFGAFFKEIHGQSPYSWQTRLAERCAHAAPPSLIAVPTGAGKTATVDALVWALAHQAKHPARDRTVGVRIVWAIDRRILVDQVYEHATRLAARLEGALPDAADPLHELATRLAGLSDGEPLVATRWRGGLGDERVDAPEPPIGPLQPQIITTTIAQVGSRLLFRGYGVSRGSLALEAGLASCDTTICLDEAHIAAPFEQTVQAIRARRAMDEGELQLPVLNLITLTATPREDNLRDAIQLDADDRHQLRQRLKAPKTARLVEPDHNLRERDRVALLADEAVAHLEAGAPTIACVVNSVSRARSLFDDLSERLQGGRADVALLIGPQRPADRQAFLDAHGATLFEGKPPPRPLVCVATQTFEVGLDADVAALVSDSASASALVQRLGRLNRRGDGEGRATIVRDTDAWLYADSEPACWEWLSRSAGPAGRVDVSVAALDARRPPASAPASAPELTDAIVELLAITDPPLGPWQEPSIDALLHGDDKSTAADVAICWRSDLRMDIGDDAATDYRRQLLQLVPPQPQELLSLSPRNARALVAARYRGTKGYAKAATQALTDVDVEGEGLDADPAEPGDTDAAVPFVVLRQGEMLEGTFDSAGSGEIAWRDLRPGDLLILPTSAGGVDRYGLAPASREAGDVAGDVRPGDWPAPIRLSAHALNAAAQGKLKKTSWKRVASKCQAVTTGGPTSRRQIDALVAELRSILPWQKALESLDPDALRDGNQLLQLRAVSPTDADGVPQLGEHEEASDEPDEPTDDLVEGPVEEAEDHPDDDQGEDGELVDLFGPLEVTWVLMRLSVRRRERPHRAAVGVEPPTLEQHALDVSELTQRYAAGAGLPPAVSGALTIAARAHDHGKADPRMQAFFRGGTAALAEVPIAKSQFGTADPRTAELARSMSRFPKGLRHEIASVAALADALDRDGALANGADQALALFGTGGHHGYGCPIPPLPRGGAPARQFTVDIAGIAGTARGDGLDGWDDGAWLERFSDVMERYGPWGAAYLQALLRLADRAVSARGD